MNIHNFNKMNKLFLISILLSGIFIISNAIAEVDPVAAKKLFNSDPIKFLDQYPINTLEIFQDKNLSHQHNLNFFGYIKLVEIDKSFKLKFTTEKDRASIPVYFLYQQYTSNTAPSYIDIPKKSLEGTLVISPPLSGSSIIVTDYSANTYRVYRDSRPNSAVLYDKVVLTANQLNYQDHNHDVAGAYIMFNQEQWQLLIQPLQITASIDEPFKNKYTFRNNKTLTMIQNMGDVNDQMILDNFNKSRSVYQKAIISAAENLDIKIKKIPKDIDSPSKYPPRVDESINTSQWHELRELIRRSLRDRISPLIKEMNIINQKIRKTKNTKIKSELEINLNDLKLSLDKYDTKYYESLKTSTNLDWIWLWLRKKNHDGSQVILEPHGGPFTEMNKRLIDKFHSESELLENLNGSKAKAFEYGKSHYQEILLQIDKIPTNAKFTDLILVLFDDTLILNYQQKGALVQKIKLDYRQHLKEIKSKGRERIINVLQDHGAKTVKLTNQKTMLLEKMGRCLPLSKIMATAIAQYGDTGVYSFINTVNTAADNPDSESSINVLNSIKFLHMNITAMKYKQTVGKKNIPDLISMLSQMALKENDSAMFLLNTHTHSMMIGKVKQSSLVNYYFYDPNFGVFKFHTTEELESSLHEYFITLKLAKMYNSYGSGTDPMFHALLINTNKLSRFRLSTGLTITDLIMPKQRPHNSSINQLQLASSSSEQQLENDMKLQSNLQALESVHLANEFTDSLTEIYNKNKLDASWLPVFDSIQKHSDGDYSLTFIRNKDQKMTQIVFDDDKIWEFKQYYTKQLKQLRKTHDFSSTPSELEPDVTQVEHLSSLNAAFNIKAIINTFRQQINEHHQNKNLNSTLNKALAIHTDINLTQMIDSTVVDILKVVNLYRIALKSSVIHTASTLNKISHIAHQGFAMGLGFTSAILDGYEYANAQSEQEKAIFGTQLAFDSSYLAINLASVGTGLIGATTASAVLGVGGDIFAGLTVGFIGLAEALGEVTDNAKAVGSYFSDIDNAYKSGGYKTINKKMKDGSSFKVYSPLAGAVITHLDLVKNRITFDSQYLYPSHHGSTGSGASNYFFFAGDFPQVQHNKSASINIRAALNYPSTAEIKPNNQLILLPATPKSYINYDYQILPGATSRHDKGFDILRKIEKTQDFDYDFYIFPSEYIAYKITQEYQPTNIKIDFDDHDQNVIMRKLDSRLKNKINYQFTGRGGRYRIGLQTGANVQLSEIDQSQTTWWIFDARYLKNNQPTLNNNTLMIGDININIGKLTTPKIMIIKQHNEMLLVDIHRRQFIPINEDLSKWPSLTKLNQQLEAELKSIHLDSQLIKVKNFIPQGQTQSVGNAYYQSKKKRYIYTPVPVQNTFLNDAKLIAINGDLAYFSNKHQLWLVDVKQPKVISQYHLFIPDNTVSIPVYSQGWIEGDSVYFSVKHTLDDGNVGKWTYKVTPNKLSLIDINGDTQFMAELVKNVKKSATMTNQFFHMRHETDNYIDLSPEKRIFASRAEVVSTSASIQAHNYRYWIIKKSKILSTVITANLDTDLPNDLLLVNHDIQRSRFYFYSHNQKNLYLQEGYNKPAKKIKFETPAGTLTRVFNQQGKLFALTSDNSIWLIDKFPWLAGVSHDWLMTNYAQVINQITRHSNQFHRKQAQLKIIGAKDSAGNLVNLWFDQASTQLIGTIQTPARQSMQYVGLSEENQWAWLLNHTDNTLYKQAVITNDIALNNKLVLASDIAEPIRSPLLAGKIIQARILSQQLQLHTPDGMVFEINKIDHNKQQPRLIALTPEWQKSNADIKLALQQLKKQYQLAEQVRLNSTSWYLPHQQRIFSARIHHKKPLVYIGESIDGGDYFYSKNKRTLYWQKSKVINMGQYSYINIEAGHSITLRIEKNAPHYKLPRIKNINILLVSGADNRNQLYINKTNLKHYGNIFILSTERRNKLRIKFDYPQKLLIGRDNNNFSIYDPLSKTNILILDANKASNNKFMFYTFNGWYYLYSILSLIEKNRLIKNQIFTINQLLK
ncbi:TcdA/TcdB pore-forming domain-containing protein [Shewanella marina]|uniref:TcdA/TcdB pore-forming domain-containing protein n=1 Tax=Shewanella marina TaxID=487319 RepID=UPI00046EF25B|nr:TcdA/TcdB pore-forming domain-containing protein [Shewanella marina]